MPETEDLYPNDGSYFLPTEPATQVRERNKDKAKTLEALTVLKEIIQRLDERIEFYNSLDAIPDKVKTDPQKFLIAHNANELIRNNLIIEKEYIEDLISTHT